MKNKTLSSLFVLLLIFISSSAYSSNLNIGVTLNPYYSWVANVGMELVDVTPVIPNGINPHSYQPRTQDILNLQNIDAIVINGMGHDEFIEPMIKAIEKEIMIIDPGMTTPHVHADGTKHGSIEHSHNFISINSAANQVYQISKSLAHLDSQNAEIYKENAKIYRKRLRAILASSINQLDSINTENLVIATTHNGYRHLLNELGLDVDLVLKQKHSGQLSISELTALKKEFAQIQPDILFSEKYFPDPTLLELVTAQETKVYDLTHGIYGEYSSEKFEQDIIYNHQTIIRAIKDWVLKNGNASG